MRAVPLGFPVAIFMISLAFGFPLDDFGTLGDCDPVLCDCHREVAHPNQVVTSAYEMSHRTDTR
jgi:hypothetical protein